jgi:tetratricopeptide (TPR) repeat protein
MPDNIIESIISDIQNKNYSAAIKRLDELIDKNPSNHDLYEIKAGCNYALGNYEYAVDDWTYAIINFKNAVDHKKELSVIYGKRGKTYLKLRNYFNASEDFGKSLKLFPESAETLNNLATCMRRLKNYDEALKFADDAVAINPDFSDAYNNRANINYCLGNIDNALKDYSSAIERNPGNAKAFFNRGSLYYHLSDEDNARKDWEKAISLDGDIKQELQKLHPEFSMVKQEPDLIPDKVITPAESEITEFKSIIKCR